MPKKKKPLIPLLPSVMNFHLDDDDRLEVKIQKSIMDFLSTIPFLNFAKIQQGPYSKNGVSDIVTCYYGRSVAIEVKRRKEEPTSLQAEYLNNNVEAMGFSSVARSVDDVIRTLETVRKKICLQ
jgi:hypothetical protein